jgi:hypothetical protein
MPLNTSKIQATKKPKAFSPKINKANNQKPKFTLKKKKA